MEPSPLKPGTVLVADRLLRPGQPAIPCPAAPLLAGDLRRRGVATVGGLLELQAPQAPPGAATTVALLPVKGGRAGLGVAAADDHPAAWPAARAALGACLSVAGPRTILLASPRSFCAGVERAIEVVERALDERPGPVYVRKQIVHNRHVVAGLEARGAVFVDELDAVPDGVTVVFSAHGVSPEVRAEASRRELDVIDATCPLVAKVHVEARRFAARGDTLILIGHTGHEEVEGTFGEAPDHTVVVQTAADVDTLDVPDPARVSYLTQTTLAVDETADVIDALRARFPALRGPSSDDICYATTNRQDALRAIVAGSDLVLVVGSENSSNSRRLVELARRCGTRSELVDDVGGIHLEWLAGAQLVGLTAGASAPPGLVDDVIAALAGLGPVEVSERITARETVRFPLPRA
jgi:4-hydroxy-3-methylbut-2-enyl diphosphate reductase